MIIYIIKRDIKFKTITSISRIKYKKIKNKIKNSNTDFNHFLKKILLNKIKNFILIYKYSYKTKEYLMNNLFQKQLGVKYPQLYQFP
ncbi:hypothetical protein [Guillardia theta]|uniref:Uncharacterized protein n=1 Tax=Guillardia theta TaxID=55529 RepID=Q9AVY8_GUITH|nr:hypothetical protein GTHECHR2174 [Guillardia theta]CAC27083.1 hypothetical protein [Guillardia theta]